MFRGIISATCTRKRLFSVVEVPRRCATFNAIPMKPAILPSDWATLKNGVRLVTEQTCAPLACVKMFVEAGPRFEIRGNNGATHFIEHVAFKGFVGTSTVTLLYFLMDNGIKLTAHTDREYQVFTAVGPNGQVENMVSILYQVACKLAFDPLEVEQAKEDCLLQIKEEEDNPRQLVFDYLHQTAFQGTTLAQSVIGPSKNYTNFTPSFVQKFMDRQFQPFRIVIAVSSTTHHSPILSMVESYFGEMKVTTSKIVYWPCRYTGSDVRFRNDDLPFAHIALAVEAGGYCSKDHFALLVMKELIGKWDISQSQGYKSHLELARASAIAEFCIRYEAFYLPYKDIGLFGVYFVVPKETDMSDMIMSIQNYWMYICNMVTGNEVERAVAAFHLKAASHTEGCEKACHDMGLQMLYYNCKLHLTELQAEFMSIDNAMMKSLGKRVFYDRCPVLAGVGPTESIPEYNRIRSGMHWLRT